MTQIIVTLDKDANPSFLQKIFENIRGVVKTSVKIKTEEVSEPSTQQPLSEQHNYIDDLPEEKKKWLEELDSLCKDVDRSVIDLNDERTRYLLSK